MGKAVLVIDMPGNCAECSLCKRNEFFNNFVDYKDINLGNAKDFYVVQ